MSDNVNSGKFFKLEDMDIRDTKPRGNCTCGAHCTSRPDYHSEWCDSLKNKPTRWHINEDYLD